MNTQDLLEKLHAHYIKPEDRTSSAGAGAVFLTEVTAPGSQRRADAVHVGLWQSRGAGEIDVCELKVSRADWRKELDNPAKAEAWWPYCTRFWIVAPDAETVPPEELPEGWGLMVPGRARRFKAVVKPSVREPEIDVALLLTLLKNTETTRVNALRSHGDKIRQDHYKEIRELRRELVTTADPEVKRRLEALDVLEKTLGLKVGTRSWDEEVHPVIAGQAIASCVRDQVSVIETTRRLWHDVRVLEQLADRMSTAAKELRNVAPGSDDL